MQAIPEIERNYNMLNPGDASWFSILDDEHARFIFENRQLVQIELKLDETGRYMYKTLILAK